MNILPHETLKRFQDEIAQKDQVDIVFYGHILISKSELSA